MASSTHYKNIVKEMNRDVQSFFDKYDTNKDSSITRDEMTQALRDANKKNPERIVSFLFQKNDSDGSDSLSITEVRTRVARMNSENINAVLDRDVETFFKFNDKDGDKKVSKDELIQRFTEQGALEPVKISEAIFRQMDKDMNGWITPNEVRDFNKKKKFNLIESDLPSN